MRTRPDQFNHKSIRIKQSNYFFSETRRRFLGRYMLLFQALKPIPNRIRWNCECCRFDLTSAANPASRSRPRKKRQDCSGCAASIAEVKMVRSRIVEIDSTFDEPQPKQPNIKIEVPLRIARDRRDVMKSTDFVFHHAGYPMPPTFSGKPFTNRLAADSGYFKNLDLFRNAAERALLQGGGNAV